MKSLSQFTLVLFLTLSFISSLPPSQAGDVFVMRHVHIINNMSGDLKLHCQSKNNDLGAKILHPGEEQILRFKVNIWKTTLFYCLAQRPWQFKIFNAFEAHRDELRCGGQCYWSVRDDGFYFSNDDTTWDRDYTWT